jgi:hypothetical protein
VWPKNSVIISGDVGIDMLLKEVYEHWEREQDYGIVWHTEEAHPEGIPEIPPMDDCPKIIFTLKPIELDDLNGVEPFRK